MLAEMIKTELRLRDRQYRVDWYPPERHVVGVESFEPLLPLAHDIRVMGSVDVGFEVFHGFPNGHIDEDRIVVVWANGGRISFLGFKPPNKAGAGIGQGVDRLKLGDETGHESVGHGRADAADIKLG